MQGAGCRQAVGCPALKPPPRALDLGESRAGIGEGGAGTAEAPSFPRGGCEVALGWGSQSRNLSRTCVCLVITVLTDCVLGTLVLERELEGIKLGRWMGGWMDG